MEEKNINSQIQDINNKLDFVIEEINKQKQKRQSIEDLVTDVSIIGKDLFNTAVRKLDDAGVEVDYENLEKFSIRVLRNMSNLNAIVELIESATDLFKDLTPIINQAGIDVLTKFQRLEEKGYFEFLKELGKLFDNILSHFTAEDIKLLADNIVSILETIKNLTQPDILHAINNGVNTYKNIDTSNIPEYSIWKAFKELNSKEGKKAIGFIMAFLKNISTDSK